MLEQDSKETNYVDHKLKTRLNHAGVRIPSFLHQYYTKCYGYKNGTLLSITLNIII